MIPRSKWGAKPITRHGQRIDPARRTGVIIHHSVTPQGKSQAEVERILRSIDNFHRSRNWGGIGYNVAVDYAGRIYEARGVDILGAHTGGRNTPNYGVVFIGDGRFNVPDKAVEALQQVVDMFQANSGKKLQVTGHGLVAATQCPGGLIRSMILQGRFDRPFPASAPAPQPTPQPAPAPAPQPAPAPAGDFVTVQRGDSYWRVAARVLGVPNTPRHAVAIGREVQRLQKLNNKQPLHPGQKLRVRAASQPAPAPAQDFVTVQRGDSYWRIATLLLGVRDNAANAAAIRREVERLQRLNNNRPLHPRQRLRVR